ncbi:tyrosine-type recombinase/integrase [Salinarimonas ramus]|nr:tyrosine-type recombinase/integrase [Salinarimonas ramus]
MADYIVQRGDYWHFVRRVPTAFAHLDRRTFVRAPLKIRVEDDPAGKRAKRAAEEFNRQLESGWRDLSEGRVQEAGIRFEAARRRARTLGLIYEPALVLAETASTDELVQRAFRLAASGKIDDPLETAAILGGVEAESEIPSLSTLFETYERFRSFSNRGKSDDQRRKWRNPKLKVIRNLLHVIGDKRIDRITRRDALTFREWWEQRVLDEGLDPGTANKDLSHINSMINEVDLKLKLGLPRTFAGLSLEGASNNKRLPFETEFIQERLLLTGALDGLNAEARRIVFVCIETGMRPSEVCNLTEDRIHLEAPVPHVEVRPDGRETKNFWSVRDMPLVGVALMAMKEQSRGFPRYRHKADGLSNLVNDFLRNAGLMPSPEHKFYGLRHSFADRLTAIRVTDEEKDSLMGHAGGLYGQGPSLAHKAAILDRMVLKPPERV